MPEQATCETCRFKDWDGCHFQPPIAGMDDYGNYRNEFPQVMNIDWCGQHTPRVVEFIEPKDELIHTNNFDKVYNNGHSYVTYHGHVMHDPDCICIKPTEKKDD